MARGESPSTRARRAQPASRARRSSGSRQTEASTLQRMDGTSARFEHGPIPGTLVFTLTADASADLAGTVDQLAGVWSTLHAQELVHARPAEFWQPTDAPQCLLLHVLFCSTTTAGCWAQNAAVVKHHGGTFAALLTHPPETRLHADLWRGAQRICRCSTPSGIVVQAADRESASPAKCLDCEGRRPGTLTDGPGQSVEEWARTYTHVDRIWSDSGALEKWSAEQLSDPGSELNRAGQVACRALEKALGTPVYLLINQWSLETGEMLMMERCPLCGALGSQLAERSPLSGCRTCRLAFR